MNATKHAKLDEEFVTAGHLLEHTKQFARMGDMPVAKASIATLIGMLKRIEAKMLEEKPAQ